MADKSQAPGAARSVTLYSPFSLVFVCQKRPEHDGILHNQFSPQCNWMPAFGTGSPMESTTLPEIFPGGDSLTSRRTGSPPEVTGKGRPPRSFRKHWPHSRSKSSSTRKLGIGQKPGAL